MISKVSVKVHPTAGGEGGYISSRDIDSGHHRREFFQRGVFSPEFLHL